MNLEAPGRPAPDDDPQSIAALQDALGPDFEIKQKLGKGSMATVYLAKERALGRFVAVKVLLPVRARDETARKRFEREAKSAAALSHPNVVQVFRLGRLRDETPYLVMRYVKGRTMEERIAAEGRLPGDLAREVLHQVASALAAAHAQGIVHRDVRPANVLWDEERRQSVLTDFGIAAILATSGEDSTRLTKTGQMVGDPRYLSPEQLRDEDLTELADMYAFGILGYELYTGQGPYKAKSNTQWITAHLSGQPIDLTRAAVPVDADVADLLKRCLNREPNHRPSAANAAKALESTSRPGSVGGSVEDPISWQGLTRRRIPQFVGGAIAIGVGFVGFVALLREQYDIPLLWLNLSFPAAACAVAAATVTAWFHGERGRQHSSILEWILLSLIGIIWLSVTGWIVTR
jgi:serine/threonine protein kinase